VHSASSKPDPFIARGARSNSTASIFGAVAYKKRCGDAPRLMGIPDPVVNVAAAIFCSPFHEVKLHRWPSTVLLYLLKLGIVASEEQATVVVVHGVGQPCK
jgi:hypothetical protein